MSATSIPRGDVGGDKNVNFIFLEPLDRPCPLGLAFVPVDPVGFEAAAHERLAQPFYGMLGIVENDGLSPVLRDKQVMEFVNLFLAGPVIHNILVNAVYRNVLADGNGYRIMRKGPNMLFDFPFHGRAEKQGLPVCGHRRENAGYVADKAHVEHAVKLVEHRGGYAGKGQGPLLEVILDATRSTDNQAGVAAEIADLHVHGSAADKQGGSKPAVLAERETFFLNLLGKFPGRCHDDCVVIHRVDKIMDERQGERRGFSGSSIGDADKVPALHYDRYRLVLDGRRVVVSLCEYIGEYPGIKREIAERVHGNIFTLFRDRCGLDKL